ncbi:hypothetical protein CVT24_001701 [Panaeolus cyanescens]|uniref:Mediator of RNA polymerase II transcription subunit 13 n=1 Tax=Panaeolus cyanescens TaxID=181874 RepID=A0A409YFJ3_9AGAR|nr:hypothetical protein CVT24_001701 [Panaeolus cyanescens]
MSFSEKALLSSTIALPLSFSISYSRFGSQKKDSIEQARRSLLQQSTSSILDIPLPAVNLKSTSELYVFVISSSPTPISPLHDLTFDSLSVIRSGTLPPPEPQTLLPDPDQQVIYSYFFEAVRSKLINDLISCSQLSSNTHIRRFKHGFLISRDSSTSDWHYKPTPRPLTFCHLQINFAYSPQGLTTHLIVHPTLIPTPLLDINHSLPLPSGTPIILIPFATPAFFLANYTGPTSGLIKQFQSSLQGLGAGRWENSTNTFILAWIKVENPQGEDKGITIIYPTSLCASYLPQSVSRQPLDFVPQLPIPLQPSPPVQASLPSLGQTNYPNLFSSPTSESLRAFRTLAVSKSKDLNNVALEVRTFVDAVVREREKERERLKRERENSAGSSPKMSRASATTPASAPTPSFEAQHPSSQTTHHTPNPNPPTTNPTQLQTPASIQNFYPSPPQTNSINPPPLDRTSPAVEPKPTSSDPPPDPAPVASTSTSHPVAPPLSSTSSTSSYDPFNGMDNSWNQSTDSYLNMGMDIDFGMSDMGMNFSMNMGNMGNSSTAAPSYSVNDRVDMDFENAFTDDDFSFFDRPAPTPSAPPQPAMTHSRNVSTTSALASSGMSPSVFNDVHLPGPGTLATSSLQQPWTPGAFMDGLTPRSMDNNTTGLPTLQTPAPGHPIESVPPTPNVHLESDSRPPLLRTQSTPHLNSFEPIPFASYHREADGKYTFGKFALPSPPTDNDDDVFTYEPPTRSAPPGSPTGTRTRPTLLHTQFEHDALLPLSVPLRPTGVPIAPLNFGLTHPTGSHLPPASVPTPVSPAATMGAATERSKSLETFANEIAVQVVDNPVWSEAWLASTSVGTKPSLSVWTSDVKLVQKLLEGVGWLRSGLTVSELFGIDRAKVITPLEAPMITIGKGDAVIQILPPALRFWDKLGLTPKHGRKNQQLLVVFEDEGEQKLDQVQTWMNALCATYESKHFGCLQPGSLQSPYRDGLLPVRFDSSLRKSISSYINSVSDETYVVLALVVPTTIMSLSSAVLRQTYAMLQKVVSDPLSHVLLQLIPEHHVYTALDNTAPFDSALDLLSLSIYNRTRVEVERLMSRRIHERSEATSMPLEAPAYTLARPLPSKVTYTRAAHTSFDVLDRYTLLHIGYHLTACGKWIVACGVDQRGEMHTVGVWLTKPPDDESEMSREEYAIKKVWDFGLDLAHRTCVEWRVVFTRLGLMSDKEMHAWLDILEDVNLSREQPPVHHSIACVIPDAPWSFISSIPTKPASPPASASVKPPHLSRSGTSPKQQTFFTDISTTTYALFPATRIPISAPPSHTIPLLSLSYVPEPPPPSDFPTTERVDPSLLLPEHIRLPHPVTILPLLSSILVNVPYSSPSTSISMTHIHLLRTYHSRSAKIPVGDDFDERLLEDMTRNYHELAVLARARWKLSEQIGKRGLPIHLAAVDAVTSALDRDWDSHTNHNQNKKAHRNGIKKPKSQRSPSLKGVDPKFRRNQKFALVGSRAARLAAKEAAS